MAQGSRVSVIGGATLCVLGAGGFFAAGILLVALLQLKEIKRGVAFQSLKSP